MILSHRRQFLFVHIAKTGGTSVRRALAGVRWREPMNVPLWIVRRICQLTGYRIGAVLPRHGSALTARETMSMQHFESYFKFAFVRNPWDRLLSSFLHLQRERQDVLRPLKVGSFDDYCRWTLAEEQGYVGRRSLLIETFRSRQSDYLTDRRGRLLMDYVGRFERLEQDFAAVAQRLGIRPGPLGHRRRSHRDRDYRSYYSDATAELAARFYADDLRLFGYAFDDAARRAA